MKSFYLLCCIALLSCGKSKTEPSSGPLSAATLLFPERNAACTSVSIVSQTESSIEFKWNPVDGAAGYELSIKNLTSGAISTHATDKTSFIKTLTRNTAYSWFVTAKSSDSNTSASEVWKFQNPGAGVTTYAPFPAENIFPLKGQIITPVNGMVTLSWKGSDSDNDILNYDIYFGTTSAPTLHTAETANTALENIAVLPKTNYFWKVVTRDKNNNTSESDLYYFSTR